MNKILRNMLENGLFMPFMDEEGGGGGGKTAEEIAAEAAAAKATEEAKAKEEAEKAKNKTLTQEQVNAIVQTEKGSAKKSLLKNLGFEDEASAKKAIEEFNKYKESQKTEEEKKQEAVNAANKAAEDAKKEAALVKTKLDAIKAGVSPKHVDNFVILANAMVTDEKPFAKVVEEMKGLYPNMFSDAAEEDDEGNSGTGSKNNPARKKIGDVSGIGKKLAENRKINDTKNPYFST